MTSMLVSFFLAALCTAGYAADCSTVLPPTWSYACEPINYYDRIGLRTGTKTAIKSALTSLRSLNDTLKTDPDIISLSYEDFDTFNPMESTTDYHAVGKSGWIIQECYYPMLVNITAVEFHKKMDCPDSNQYSNQTWMILETLSDVIVKLKKLAKTESSLSAGPQCSVISDPVCIRPSYHTSRAADGEPFTEDQIRVRNAFSLVNTLILYFNALDGNDFFI